MASRRGSRRGSDQPPLERDTTRRSHLAGSGEHLLALCARSLVREENQAESAGRGLSVSLRGRLCATKALKGGRHGRLTLPSCTRDEGRPLGLGLQGSGSKPTEAAPAQRLGW